MISSSVTGISTKDGFVPIEVLVHILKWLERRDKRTVRLISRSWNQAYSFVPCLSVRKLMFDMYHDNIPHPSVILYSDSDYPELSKCIAQTLLSEEYQTTLASLKNSKGKAGITALQLAIWNSNPNWNLKQKKWQSYSLTKRVSFCLRGILEGNEYCCIAWLQCCPSVVFKLIQTNDNQPEFSKTRSFHYLEMAVLSHNYEAALCLLDSELKTSQFHVHSLWQKIYNSCAQDTFCTVSFMFYTRQSLGGDFFPPSMEHLQEIRALTGAASLLRTCDSSIDLFDDVFLRALPRLDLNNAHCQLLLWVFRCDHAGIVHRLLLDPRVDVTRWNNLPLRICLYQGTVSTVMKIIQDPRVDLNVSEPGQKDFVPTPLEYAIQSTRCELINILLKDSRMDPSLFDNRAVQLAAACKSPFILQLLLRDPRVDPSAGNNKAIRIAAAYGRSMCLNLLLQDPRVDPSALNNDAVIRAVTANKSISHDIDRLLEPVRKWYFPAGTPDYDETLQLLLQDPRVDPSDQDNRALILAIKRIYPDFDISLVGNKELACYMPDPMKTFEIQDKSLLSLPPEGDIIVRMLLMHPRVQDKMRQMIGNVPFFGLKGSIFEGWI